MSPLRVDFFPSVCVLSLILLSPEALRKQSMCILSGPVKETVEQRMLGAWSRYGSTALCNTMRDDSSLTEERVLEFLFLFVFFLCREAAFQRCSKSVNV